MKDLIYYPTFEPRDLNWIKYALIYIDKFSPIIPDSGMTELSDLYWKLSDDTDLVKSFTPKWQHGAIASTKAIREIEFIQRHPEQFRDIFNNVNLIRAWTDVRQQTFKVYEEKYNIPFKFYCLENNLATECAGGIKLSRELAHLFMTFLAEEIAYEENATPITDNPKLDLLSTYIRAKDNETESRINAVNTMIDQHLPDKIENIDIDKLIEFRRNTGIVELRKNFNKTLDRFYEAFENDSDITDFVKDLGAINKDFIKEISFFFGGLTSIGLGGLILFNNPNSTNLEIVKQIVEGTIFTVGGLVGINQAWKLNDKRRQARKFLTKLERIL
ncbi:hypothetical protein ES705_34983 [subsurface metagenome]